MALNRKFGLSINDAIEALRQKQPQITGAFERVQNVVNDLWHTVVNLADQVVNWTQSVDTNGFQLLNLSSLDVAGLIRSTAFVAPASGVGLELTYTGGLGYVQAYDRAAAVYKPLNVSGLGVTISGQGVIILAGVPVYANNAAAITGGLTVGALYRTGANPDPVCIVH